MLSMCTPGYGPVFSTITPQWLKLVTCRFFDPASGSVLMGGIFTIRFALGQNSDHFPFRDLQQEEHGFFPHDALKINIIHLEDKNKGSNIDAAI